jgi:hypothetical protein
MNDKWADVSRRLHELSDDEVRRQARDCAEWVANEVTADTDSGTVYKLVERHCEDVLLGNRGRALQVIGYYGWADALMGGAADYEDSPIYLFEEDVYEIAAELLEEQGIKVN